MMWKCGSFEFDTRKPVVMGILNVTPDSFSDGGTHNTPEAALAWAQQMIDEGAHMIDVGGESTRSGSAEVSVEEETARVLPVVRALAEQGVCVSVDTRHAAVAKACVEVGAAIINDVSGFRDPAMVQVAAESDCGVVVMHMKGEPGTMQQNPQYDDVVAEVRDYLRDQAVMLEAAGVAPERICVDPGPGFGKTASQTLELVRNFQEFARLGYPDNVAETVKALSDMRPYAFLGLGCNVPLVAEPGEELEGKIAMLNQAITELCSLPDSQIIDISSFYESEPAYYEDQDTFVNAVVLLRTGIAPKELLGYLHAIENSLGRVREIENGPRTCDLDILDYQLYVTDNDVLTLPHPRILERDFVLKPLLELRPNHVLADDVRVAQAAKPESERYGKAERVSR